MSVKFQQETVKDAPIPGGRKEGIAHDIGERLTGGETAQGYLAVSIKTIFNKLDDETDMHRLLGLPFAATEQPPPHEDAHIGLPVSSTRSPCVMDREGS